MPLELLYLAFCWFVILQATLTPLKAQNRSDAWEQQAEARARQLIMQNGQGTNPALRTELLKMGKLDQNIRTRLSEATSKEEPKTQKEMDVTDSKLTSELKQIVASDGWPTIKLVGPQASQAASLILIHSPDQKWKAALLPKLRRLADEGKIFPGDIATLGDRILVAEGKKQVFGTQFKEV